MALQEPEIERREYQDNSDVYYQPLPEVVPEEQDVHADHDRYQREHVKHDGCLSSHRFVLLGRDGVEQERRLRWRAHVRQLHCPGLGPPLVHRTKKPRRSAAWAARESMIVTRARSDGC